LSRLLGSGFFTVEMRGGQVCLYNTALGFNVTGLGNVALNPDEARDLRKFIKKNVPKSGA
jgi:hypothetical protein